MEIREIESIIEGLLFASGDALSLDKIAEIVGIDRKTARLILSNMTLNLQNSRRGIALRQLGDKYQLCTRMEHSTYIKKLFEPRQKQGLSQAAFETLAIIAYKSPITKAKIEQIRGVSSDSAVNRLIERNLVREAGRMDSPGKPILYETTDEFLRSFGFNSIKDLPALDMNEIQTVMENEPIE